MSVLSGAVLGRQFLNVALLDQLIGWVDDVLFPTQLFVHLQELVHFLLQGDRKFWQLQGRTGCFGPRGEQSHALQLSPNVRRSNEMTTREMERKHRVMFEPNSKGD